MDESELRDALRPIFLQECSEHLESMTTTLIAFEQEIDAQATEVGGTSDDGGSAADLRELFRLAHSLKGGARVAGFASIGTGMHTLESMLDQWRSGTLSPSSESVSAMLGVIDVVSDIIGSCESSDPSPADEERLDDALVILTESTTSGTTEATNVELPTDPGDALTSPDSNTTSSAVSQAYPAVGAEEPAEPGPALLGDQVIDEQPSAESPADDLVLPSPRGAHSGASESPGPTGRKIRVDAGRLDRLISSSSDLSVAQHRLTERTSQMRELRDEFTHLQDRLMSELNLRSERTDRQSPGAADIRDLLANYRSQLVATERDLLADQHAIGRASTDVQGEALKMRMLPLNTVVPTFTRLVRDTANDLGKNVTLSVRGGDIEIDRTILEGLKDPVTHLLRNAVDHGVESPNAREAAGKPRTATIGLSVKLSGGRVVVAVVDDGAGIDERAARLKAEKLGLLATGREASLEQIVTLPGITTRTEITEHSGRGVGLDVVASQTRALRGTLSIESEQGHGSTFTIAVPMSLTTMGALLVRCGASTLAIPQSHIDTLVRVKADDVRWLGPDQTITLGNHAVRLRPLAEAIGLRSHPQSDDESVLDVVILGEGDRRRGFVVDEFVDEREILLRGLGTHLRHLNLLLGVSIMSDGSMCVVVNGPALIAASGSSSGNRTQQGSAESTARKRVLVVDDSVTTRTLEQAVFESAGYEVQAACDGDQAWGKIQSGDFDLIVSDIDMPIADGYELVRRIRASATFAHLPVIMVSANEPQVAAPAAAEVGADAFVQKREFSPEELLATAQSLLGESQVAAEALASA
ncbi:MAG: response regulator [Actinobacteria bacterium]|nr:response regulator [Actinomycetota bacterium]